MSFQTVSQKQCPTPYPHNLSDEECRKRRNKHMKDYKTVICSPSYLPVPPTALEYLPKLRVK